MEILLEYVTAYQEEFDYKSSLPSTVTLSQFFACFLLPWLLAPSGKVNINFYKSSQLIKSYTAITVLVFGATALATASLVYVSHLKYITCFVATNIVDIYLFRLHIL